MKSGTPLARLAVSLTLALGVIVPTACGDDESAQDRYCEAGKSLNASVSALVEVDVVAEGTNGVSAALEDVNNDLSELGESASDAASDEVDTLKAAVGELEDALSAAGDSLTADNAVSVINAIDGIRLAFSGVGETLTDC